MFDFPSSPALNATYTSGGKTYVWDGEKWKQRPNAEGYTAKTALAKNYLTNGGMRISQQNAVSTTYSANGLYIADQWMVQFITTGTPGFALTPNVYTDDDEVEWWIRLNSTAADTSIAATEYYTVRQMVEGWDMADFCWGTPHAKPAVLRFKARSSIAGKFCVSLRDVAGSVGFTRLLDIAANTTTLYVVPIPPCTGGTWAIDNTLCMHLNFSVAAGSNYTTGIDNGQWNVVANIGLACPGIGNWLSVTGQTFEFGNVALHLDPDASGLAPPWQIADFHAELLKCKRYWQRTTGYWSGTTVSSAGYYPYYKYTVPARAAPTLSGVNQLNGGFPAAVGSLVDLGMDGCVETRTSNASGVGVLRTDVTVNARMA